MSFEMTAVERLQRIKSLNSQCVKALDHFNMGELPEMTVQEMGTLSWALDQVYRICTLNLDRARKLQESQPSQANW